MEGKVGSRSIVVSEAGRKKGAEIVTPRHANHTLRRKLAQTYLFAAQRFAWQLKRNGE
jgi:hypothetical protein